VLAKDKSCLLGPEGNGPIGTNKDLLWGAAAVADFLNEISATRVSRSQIYHWLDAGLLPAGKFGGKIVASKRAIQARFQQITRAKE
jgi:hypothetical protein